MIDSLSSPCSPIARHLLYEYNLRQTASAEPRMRVGSCCSAALTLILAVASVTARSSGYESPDRHIQVYLHPSPSSSSPHTSAPTLSADQAKAVLSHHLGDPISDFDEIPADEGLWSHLIGMWSGHGQGNGRQAAGARIVIVDGGVASQCECCISTRAAASDSIRGPYRPAEQRFNVPLHTGCSFPSMSWNRGD